MPVKPRVLKVTPVTRSRLFQVEAVDLEFNNGEQRQFERLASGGHGAVMIAAVTANNEIVLIREYAVGLEDYLLTLPKGQIDAGEDALEAANRELQEEAGFKAAKLTWLRQLSAVPNYTTYRIDLVLAEELTPSQLPGDEPEPLEVIRWPLAQLDELALKPQFSEGRAIAALYLVAAHLQNRDNH